MSRSFLVPSISCDHCKHAIETEVAGVTGVELVTVDVASKLVTVEGGADVEVMAAIVEAGYDVAGAGAGSA